jgi:hypothetical protein
MPSTITLGGARLSLSNPALLMARVRIASTYGDNPSRRQLPSRFRPGSPWLHPTEGRSKRTAAVNRHRALQDGGASLHLS